MENRQWPVVNVVWDQLVILRSINETGAINFTLLKALGEIQINQTADRKEIEEALDFYRDFMGC